MVDETRLGTSSSGVMSDGSYHGSCSNGMIFLYLLSLSSVGYVG